MLYLEALNRARALAACPLFRQFCMLSMALSFWSSTPTELAASNGILSVGSSPLEQRTIQVSNPVRFDMVAVPRRIQIYNILQGNIK